MTNRIKCDQKLASITAVEQYVHCKKDNRNRHQALVLTSEKGASYPIALYVCAQAFGDFAIVTIEWSGSYGKDYPSDFTTDTSTFRFVHRSLQISSKDIWGRDISVSISVIN